MELNLNKPICFFDLETTGTNIATDRIVEISILKLFPDGSKQSNTWLVNPTIPIPKEAESVHGISNERVANAPTFKDIAFQVNEMLSDSDLAGFNSNRFDIPLLAEEMLRVGVDFDMSNVTTIDVQTIFHKKEQRTLSAAYKFYCDADLENAHSAMADTQATYQILKAQIEKYPDLQNDMQWLGAFTSHKKNVDLAGFIVYNDAGKEVFTFGKHKGQSVEDVLSQDVGYYGWLMNADFPLYTKKMIKKIVQRKK